MSGGRLVFLDTETCGLALTDPIWEVAYIVRDPGEPDVEAQFFVAHDVAYAANLPPGFRADHDARYNAALALTPGDAVRAIHAVTSGRAHIVGAVPNFDTERIERLMRALDMVPGWHYHLIDVENLAVGYLAAKGRRLDPPWDSDEVSEAVGVEPQPEDQRHTALGDVRWVRDLYDAVMGDRG